AVVLIECRIPNPHVQTILVTDTRHADHRVYLREWEMRAVGSVVRARRNELDRVGTEDGKIANILLPHRQSPTVVGIGLWPVTKLVPAQWVFRCRRNVEAVRQSDLAFR